jgi:alpha-tubulin suppressor-like RCC1 family protein
MAVGHTHLCVVRDAQVQCWTNNEMAQAAVGRPEAVVGPPLPIVDLGRGYAAEWVAAGGAHNCALLSDGALKCWGKNDFGQLGLGDAIERGPDPTAMGDGLPAVDLGADARAVSVALGPIHSCALLADGRVKCWGANFDGELGLGDTDHRGDAPGEMGDALPAIDLGADTKVLSIAAGADHTCALLAPGDVKCWGSSKWGALGIPDLGSRGDAPGEMGDTLPIVVQKAGSTVVGLSLGANHSCVLHADGQAKCWGRNAEDLCDMEPDAPCGIVVGRVGRLGTGDPLNRWSADHPAIDLGTGETAEAVVAGQEHTCALLPGGRAKCWGANDQGQLGIEDGSDRGRTPEELGDGLPVIDLGKDARVTEIGVGSSISCALLADDRIKCWGLRLGGQVEGSMGDNLPAIEF